MSQMKSEIGRLHQIRLAAKELVEGATRLPDDTEEFAAFDRQGVQRGEFVLRTNAAYVQRDQLNRLAELLGCEVGEVSYCPTCGSSVNCFIGGLPPGDVPTSRICSKCGKADVPAHWTSCECGGEEFE